MKGFLDIVMYFFVFLVIIAALRNPRGFATDVAAPAQAAGGFSNQVLSNVPVS